MSTIKTKDGAEIYAGAPHGLAETHRDQLNEDLLSFIKG
jgi:non-heme chloroperoxidase